MSQWWHIDSAQSESKVPDVKVRTKNSNTVLFFYPTAFHPTFFLPQEPSAY